MQRLDAYVYMTGDISSLHGAYIQMSYITIIRHCCSHIYMIVIYSLQALSQFSKKGKRKKENEKELI